MAKHMDSILKSLDSYIAWPLKSNFSFYLAKMYILDQS